MAANKKTYGTTRSGRTIDDDLVEELAAKAERGYDVDEILRRRGGRAADRFRSGQRRVGAARP